MPLEPSHPDEPALHHALRDAFNERVSNTDFLIWITVRPTGWGSKFEYLDRIVKRTQSWLDELDPAAVESDKLPVAKFEDPAADIRVRAIPKKPEARGQRADEIVGNPEPVLTGWT